MKRRIREDTARGSSQVGMSGVDGRAGHGYGHIGRPRGPGQHWKQGETYPYRKEGGTLRDLYPELFDDSDDTDADVDVALSTQLSNRTGADYGGVDSLAVRMNVRDRSSFVGADSRISEADLDPQRAVGGSLKLERIFTPSGRSNPAASRVSGTKWGWAGPHLADAHPPDDAEDIDDIFTPQDLGSENDEASAPQRVTQLMRAKNRSTR